MTHLTLRQTKNSTEQVSGSCINDLYEFTLQLAQDPDNTSYIEGRINADTSSKDRVNALHTLNDQDIPVTNNNQGRWDNLFVTATTYAIVFEDPNVESVLISSLGIGSGGGITTTEAANVTTLPANLFKNNSSIHTFNEFKYFTKVNSIPQECFSNSSIEEITLPYSVTSISINAFSGCANLTNINFDNVLSLSINCFANASLDDVDIRIPSLQSVGNAAFQNTKIKSVSDLGQISSLPRSIFGSCSKLTSITLPSSCAVLESGAIQSVSLLSDINVENIQTIGPSNFSWCNNITKVMNFKSLTTLSGNVTDSGWLTLSGVLYMYLPKITALYQGFDTGGNNVRGLCVQGGYSNTCSSFNIVYLKNINSIYTGCFCGSRISKLVINNTTPPVVNKSTNGSTVDSLIGSSQSRSDILAIYVPDSAVSTYKDSANHPYWAALSSRIYPMSQLNQVATEDAWNELSDSDKANTLITEYM